MKLPSFQPDGTEWDGDPEWCRGCGLSDLPVARLMNWDGGGLCPYCHELWQLTGEPSSHSRPMFAGITAYWSEEAVG